MIIEVFVSSPGRACCCGIFTSGEEPDEPSGAQQPEQLTINPTSSADILPVMSSVL